MNPEILELFDRYTNLTSDRQQAAWLTLADLLDRSRSIETVFVEPDGCHSYNVREAAARLHLSSPEVYHLILAGRLDSFWSGDAVRVPLAEIERYETEAPAPPC